MSVLDGVRARAEAASPPWGEPSHELIGITAKLFSALDAVQSLCWSADEERRDLYPDEVREAIKEALA